MLNSEVLSYPEFTIILVKKVKRLFSGDQHLEDDHDPHFFLLPAPLAQDIQTIARQNYF